MALGEKSTRTARRVAELELDANRLFLLSFPSTNRKTKQEAKQGDAANKLRDSSNTARSPDPLRQKGLFKEDLCVILISSFFSRSGAIVSNHRSIT